MLEKTWNPDLSSYEVTFDLPPDLEIEQATVVGDFNDWDEGAHPMTLGDDGRWSATLPLEPGRHRFRYHLGGGEWENDWSADDYVPNDHGGADSVVHVPDPPAEPPAAKRAASKKQAAAKTSPTNKRATAKKPTGKKVTGMKGADGQSDVGSPTV